MTLQINKRHLSVFVKFSGGSLKVKGDNFDAEYFIHGNHLTLKLPPGSYTISYEVVEPYDIKVLYKDQVDIR